MLRSRIAVSAAVLLFSGLLVGSSGAQTATAQPVGKPLQLLKITEGPSHAKAKRHAKLAHKTMAKRHIKMAARKRSHTQIATSGRHRQLVSAHAVDIPPPETAVPTAPAPAPAEVAAFAPMPLPTPVAAPAVQDPNEVVVAGQTVKVASPSDVNEIDLAANDAATQTNDAAPPSSIGIPTGREITAPQKADAAPAATVEPSKPSPVGSTPWILQVMAALGGAVTAGSVAWFLIGGTPQRTYG